MYIYIYIYTCLAMNVANTSTGNNVGGICNVWQCHNPLDIDFTGTSTDNTIL